MRAKLLIPMTVAVVAVVVIGVAGLNFFGGEPAAPVTLESAAASLAQPGATQAAGSTSAPAAAPQTPTAGDSAAATASDDLTGTWTLANDGSSFLGYRVQEELVGIGATTAVGRTAAVNGTLEFDGAAITAVAIEADVSQLASDDSRRDGALRRQALESATYPTATFVLTEPIALDGVPAEGAEIEAVATGELTIREVTRVVSIPLRGQLTDGRVLVVGSTEIAFADFEIAQPRAAAVLSVSDRATLELQLIFERA